MLLEPSKNNCSSQFWADELENTKTLLEQIDQAIYVLSTSVCDAGGVVEYTLDTGQSSQTVKRADLPRLHQQRADLLVLIDQLERKLGLHGSASRQIVPGF